MQLDEGTIAVLLGRCAFDPDAKAVLRLVCKTLREQVFCLALLRLMAASSIYCVSSESSWRIDQGSLLQADLSFVSLKPQQQSLHLDLTRFKNLTALDISEAPVS